jgi:hypothetical protein
LEWQHILSYEDSHCAIPIINIINVELYDLGSNFVI